MNVELIGFIAATLTTISFVPQVYKAYKTKSTESISLFMYSIFFVGMVLWLIYGIYLDSWPMMIANSITSVLAFLILLLKIKYK